MDATLSEKTSLAGLAGKYLPFLPGIKSYGISVLKVRETMLYTNTTVVPHMPDCIKGVVKALLDIDRVLTIQGHALEPLPTAIQAIPDGL
jgi:hypothetical protein